MAGTQSPLFLPHRDKAGYHMIFGCLDVSMMCPLLKNELHFNPLLIFMPALQFQNFDPFNSITIHLSICFVVDILSHPLVTYCTVNVISDLVHVTFLIVGPWVIVVLR